MEIVVNRCYGGFGISKAVYDKLELEWDGYEYIDNDDLGIKSDNFYAYRTDKRLIKAIKEVGLKEAGGKFSRLEIVEIPDNVEWEIYDYDGIETIHEKHRTW